MVYKTIVLTLYPSSRVRDKLSKQMDVIDNILERYYGKRLYCFLDIDHYVWIWRQWIDRYRQYHVASIDATVREYLLRIQRYPKLDAKSKRLPKRWYVVPMKDMNIRLIHKTMLGQHTFHVHLPKIGWIRSRGSRSISKMMECSIRRAIVYQDGDRYMCKLIMSDHRVTDSILERIRYCKRPIQIRPTDIPYVLWDGETLIHISSSRSLRILELIHQTDIALLECRDMELREILRKRRSRYKTALKLALRSIIHTQILQYRLRGYDMVILLDILDIFRDDESWRLVREIWEESTHHPDLLPVYVESICGNALCAQCTWYMIKTRHKFNSSSIECIYTYQDDTFTDTLVKTCLHCETRYRAVLNTSRVTMTAVQSLFFTYPRLL